MSLTVDDDDVQHGSVAVGRSTHVDAGVRHLTCSDHQHADQHLRLNLLCYDDAAPSVRTYLLAILRTNTHLQCDAQTADNIMRPSQIFALANIWPWPRHPKSWS